ncbi:MAG: hypothetical protein J6Y03_04160 [Alphaproteobacteria bacterium]|nr:hypothetical protein [Alphaproteobacteria bacterium]
MPISDYNFRAPSASKERNTTYVFFCEGKTEAELIERINCAQILDGINIQYARIPNLDDNDNGIYFTPQRILDYYRDMVTDNVKWIYSYPRPSKDDRQTDCCKLVKDKNTKICLLVDTDVFFKVEPNITYDNLDNIQNNKLQKDYRHLPSNDMRAALAERSGLLNKYSYPPTKEQEYIFMEQELNFEDFFVLFFMDGDTYKKKWFKKRFGPIEYNAVDRSHYFGGDLDNSKNGEREIKPAFHDVTGVGKDISVWLRLHVTDTKAWTECIKRAKERMEWNKRHKDRQGNFESTSWPYRFGLVDFLARHIKQEDENGK